MTNFGRMARGSGTDKRVGRPSIRLLWEKRTRFVAQFACFFVFFSLRCFPSSLSCTSYKGFLFFRSPILFLFIELVSCVHHVNQWSSRRHTLCCRLRANLFVATGSWVKGYDEARSLLNRPTRNLVPFFFSRSAHPVILLQRVPVTANLDKFKLSPWNTWILERQNGEHHQGLSAFRHKRVIISFSI